MGEVSDLFALTAINLSTLTNLSLEKTTSRQRSWLVKIKPNLHRFSFPIPSYAFTQDIGRAQRFRIRPSVKPAMVEKTLIL
jgi:hypothetical protein